VLDFDYALASEKLTPTRTDTPSNLGQLFFRGSLMAINSLRDPDPVKFDTEVAMSPDLKETLTKLINLEIRDEPDHVGPPINILEIGKSGATWIAGGEGCSLNIVQSSGTLNSR
jgi:hypothetical protein